MSYRQDARAQYWSNEIKSNTEEQARYALGWRIMEIEEQCARLKAAIAALDTVLERPTLEETEG